MPLRKELTTNFDRCLYGSILQKVILLKRGDDQQQGTVTTYTLFNIRWSELHKSGETIQGDMDANHTTTIHIPRIEMNRIGVWYFSPLDRFIDVAGAIWQPESPQQFANRLFTNHVHIDVRMVVPGPYGNP